MTNVGNNEKTYARKVWIKGSIYALIVILILLFKATFSVLLLILAGALIAIFFRGFAELICRRTRWRQGTCLAVSVIGTLFLLFGVFWLIGNTIQNQFEQLSTTLPVTIENAKQQLRQTSLGKYLVEEASSPESMNKAQGVAGTLFKSTFGVFGDLYVVLFLGIFFTISPRVYKHGIISMMPPRQQEKAAAVLNVLGEKLRKWLKGQLFSMVIVMVLTSVGLLIMGIPMWLVLAIIAGVLNFIPNFGPLIAMIPAVLVAFLQGPVTAIIVAGLYIVIQVIESNFLTPMVQQRLINLPPALIIKAQLLISPFAGGWGLVLATPLMVIILTLVQELYINPRQAA